MGVWNWIKTQATGVDEDEEIAREAWLEPAVDKQAKISAAKYADTVPDYQAQYDKHDKLDDVYEHGSEFNIGFEQELDARASALGSFGDKAISKTLATIWRAVPLWVWLAVIVGAVFYFWPVIRTVLKARPKGK